MLNALLQFKPRDVPFRVALRNTLAVALPLAAGTACGHELLGLGIAVGALNTMFTDQPGPYRLRVQRMLLSAFGAALSAWVGYSIGGHSAAVVAAALVWGFAGGLLVALGPDTARGGMIAMIVLVVTSADPSAEPGALGPAAAIFAGGLLQTAFAVAAWPLQRYRPEREAIANLMRQLATITRAAPGDTAQPPPSTQMLLDTERILHGRHRARGVAVQTFRILAELAERLRREVLALADLENGLRADPATVSTADAVGHLRQAAAKVLDSTAAALDDARPPDAATALADVAAALARLPRPSTTADAGREEGALVLVRARGEGIAGKLRAIVRNAEFAGSRGELRAAEREAVLPRELRSGNVLAVLRSNLSLQSAACRHALRCAVALALASAIERSFALPHGYWFPMTVAIVLRPDFASTFRVGLLRVAGTLAGLVVATLLVHYAFGSDYEKIALLALLCFAFRLLATMNYGVAVMMLTAAIVVLLSLAGVSPAESMSARGIGTALGSALALAAYALWPTWERGRARTALADMIAAYGRYFAGLVPESWPLDGAALATARRETRSTRCNAQASLDRLRDEPRSDPTLVALAEGVFANANRCVRAGMALEAAAQDSPRLVLPPQAQAFAGLAAGRFEDIAGALRDGRPTAATPDLRHAERKLRDVLDGWADTPAKHVAAAAIADAADRFTDALDTLSDLAGSAPPEPVAATSAVPSG